MFIFVHPYFIQKGLKLYIQLRFSIYSDNISAVFRFWHSSLATQFMYYKSVSWRKKDRVKNHIEIKVWFIFNVVQFESLRPWIHNTSFIDSVLHFVADNDSEILLFNKYENCTWLMILLLLWFVMMMSAKLTNVRSNEMWRRNLTHANYCKSIIHAWLASCIPRCRRWYSVRLPRLFSLLTNYLLALTHKCDN